MGKVVVAPSANRDLASIIEELVRSAGDSTAQRYATEFRLFFDRIADFVSIGAPRPEFGPLARIGVVAPYIVIYDAADDGATVLPILHGHRRITARMIRR